MITIQENIPLANHTAFAIGGPARFFVNAQKQADIIEAYTWATENKHQIFFLGEGSNIIVNDNGYHGLVVKIETKGIELVTPETIHVQAGEKWDDVVAFANQHNLWGIENLSHIPGTSGAFPIQNVGAYGQDASQVIEHVTAYDTHHNKTVRLSAGECGFGYRSSIFNTTHAHRYIILSITLRLSQKPSPNVSYPDLRAYFEEKKITEPTLLEIRKAIIHIRETKLPHPPKLGSAGSFFKNVLLPKDNKEKTLSHMRGYFNDEWMEKAEKKIDAFSTDSFIKIPAGMLIDMCNLKGHAVGGASVHTNHALAIVNKEKNATAHDVLTLMQHIRKTVFKKTGITIEPEPQFIGFSQKEIEPYFEI